MTTTAAAPDAPQPGITSALVERAFDLRGVTLPPDIRRLAAQCALDWFAVALAGAHEPLVEVLAAEAAAEGGHPLATRLGTGDRLSAQQAALVNGTAGHALDYDDFNMAPFAHVTAAVLPAVLALGERQRSSWPAVLSAFVAGTETACRIGLLVAPEHYRRGFHSTATIGTFGAAAACADLLGLDRQRTGWALGIAGTQAAGLKCMFGTMCKPLHAGKAAQSGLLAAGLARRGFTSREDVLDCAQGFAATHSDGAALDAALADPPGGFHLRGTLFKFHASCYLTHAPIEAARRLRGEHGVVPEAVRRVTVQVGPDCDGVCTIPEPRTGLEAKFSLRLTVAAALLGLDTGSLASFTDALAADPALTALRDRVEVDIVPGRSATDATVTVTLGDGRRAAVRHDAGRPAEDLDAQEARLAAKFHSLVAPVLGDAGSRRLADALLDESFAGCVTAVTALAK